MRFRYILPGFLKGLKQNKQNMIMSTYKGLLGICIKSKKTACIYTVCTNQPVKILQANCLATYGSSACQGSLSWNVELLTPSTQMSKN